MSDSSKGKNSNSNNSDSQSEDNSYLKKDDEDLEKEMEEEETNLDKLNPKKETKPKDKKFPLITENMFPRRFPLMRKKARKLSFQSSSSSSDELDKKIKRDLEQTFFEKLTEFQKDKAKSDKEYFESNFTLLKNDFKIIQECEESIFKDTSIDIMFIMDLTGSMGGFLSEAKRNIKKITEEINSHNPGSKIRLSFIGYRDFDSKDEPRNYEIINFTEDIETLISTIKKYECYGGGDQPEDIAGALNQALKMDWKSSAKYVVLVCDAPCHGSKYHDIYIDSFKEGDPAGYNIEELMEQFKNMDITFYCVEINNSTKKMFDIMRKVYNDDNKFSVESIGNSYEKLSFFVAFSASELLGNTKYNKVNFSNVLEKCRKDSIEKIMKKYNKNNNINNNSINTDETLTQNLINELENMNLDGEDKKLVQFINRMNNLNIDNFNNNITNINNNKNNNEINNIDIEFNENDIIDLFNKDMNYSIHGITYNKNNSKSFNNFKEPSIVEQFFKTNITINNIISEGNNNSNNKIKISFTDNKLGKDLEGRIPKKIEKKYLDDVKLLTNKYCLTDLICEQIADYFNIELKSEAIYFMKFKKDVIYLKEEQNNEKIKLIIADIAIPFSVNLSVEPTKKILQSFTHFSYQISLGELMITNLEYNKEKGKITSYDIYYLKDNGYKNILKFFSNHVCNDICKFLDLVHPRKKINQIEINEHFFSKKYNPHYILCKCCSIPIRKYSDEKYCCRCACDKLRSLKKIICEECHQIFDCFTYEYNSNLINYPVKCKNCRKTLF